ncbi:MAG TPA: SRPBCC family protein [Polyangiaceae bacterium]|nr:SRPBCC family protein [Polyangiaceae bacterium]
MATLHNSVLIDAAPASIWDAVRDIGALHTRLVPGFVVDTKLDGDARIVTFGNGLVARERIISSDDERRRLAWNAEGGQTKHYNAVLQIFAHGSGSRVEWTTDLLPHEMAKPVQAMQEQALATMKRTLESGR